MDNIQTWWEIPSIVHFCNVFSPFCKDICPIGINEFEQAIEENSTLLTDMAIRFIKICGFHDSNSKKWWIYMQNCFKKKHIEYNIEYSLGSVTYFDDLTCKLKVKCIYILCHMILDLPHIQKKISHNHKLWHTFNVKPLGYDLNNSVYWYFGTTRLYREDFENTIDLSVNSSVLHETVQCNLLNNCESSKINIQKNLLTKPYPSGILGSGKWNIICDDDNDTWHSLAATTQYSKNKNIKFLHNSICNIITNLPNLKRHKSCYKYIDSSLQRKSQIQNRHTRCLRSMFVANVDENIKVSQAEHSDIVSQLDKTKGNQDVCAQNKDMSHFTQNKIKQTTFRNETEIKLKFNNASTIKINSANIKSINDFYISNIHQNCLKRVGQVNNEYYEQENSQDFDYSKPNLRNSKQLKNKITLPIFKNTNC